MDSFIIRARQAHGNKYNYSKVNYINASKKIIIICPIHGDFEQIPRLHYSSNGCKKCANTYNSIIKTSNNEEFIQKAIKIHGDRYDYSNIEYIRAIKNINILCKIHGIFNQTPNSHLRGRGCPKCGGSVKLNTKIFIEKAIKKHGNIYDYSNVNYINTNTKITIICKKHGSFNQTPNSHLRGNGCGCNNCGIEKMKKMQRMPITIFIERAKMVHGDKYDYSKINYINIDTKIIIICPIHGNFLQSPYCHIKFNQGCQRCNKKGYSNAQILWLNFISLYYNIYIQHAENSNEYVIPNTKYKADGYCKETNTIYEYHGSYWHGDPNIYKKMKLIRLQNAHLMNYIKKH